MKSPASQRLSVVITEDVAVVRYDWTALDAVRFALWLLRISLVHLVRREPAGFTTTYPGPLRVVGGGPVPNITFRGSEPSGEAE